MRNQSKRPRPIRAIWTQHDHLTNSLWQEDRTSFYVPEQRAVFVFLSRYPFSFA